MEGTIEVQLRCEQCDTPFVFRRPRGKPGRNPSRCASCSGYVVPILTRMTHNELDVIKELDRRFRLRDTSQRDHPALADAIREVARSTTLPTRYDAFMLLAEESMASAAIIYRRFRREVVATESAARRAHSGT